ncbi:site-specific integrase [Devosia sp. J2-20]|uniref:tyrosine-type recombinase/integrase n=1 Tax=Devosia sp. J2-20 TaxID=3026161 RepID=UPI00249C984C|nr:site-specific integrase [Devosia sp. J2-20]WDQ98164.1 site-specific integrase [Devosia sp. J2-20]
MKLEAKVRGLVKDTDRRGNVRYYYRRKGFPKVRLRSEFGTDAFREELRCAELGIPFGGAPQLPQPANTTLVRAGSFRWLCLEYLRRAKSQWGAMTHARKSRMLADICDSTSLSKTGTRTGDLPFLGMQLKHVAQLRDDKADMPNVANRRIKEISALYNWAIGTGLAQINPADKCARLKAPTEGYHTWTLPEISQYQATHPPGTKADLWLRILLFTGLRKSDASTLGRQHIYEVNSERRIRITPSKTRESSAVVVDIPLLAPLAEAIDALPRTQLTFMAKANGTPHTSNTLGSYMRDWCDAAGLKHCTSHGLRKAGAVIAAEAGATSQQLQAIFGWTTSQQADHYTKAASRQKLATEGARHLRLTE